MPLWPFGKRHDTRFLRAIAAYGFEKCGIRNRTLLIGLGPNSFRNPPVATPLEGRLPPVEQFKFLDAPNQGDVISAFLDSVESRSALSIEIGSNLDVAGSGQRDYRDAVARLAGATLPKLEELILSDMYLTYNGGALFGDIGDVSAALAACPNLRLLSLHGAVALSGPLDLPRLERLTLRPVDTCAGYGDMPTQETISHLLGSRLPQLRSLDFEGDPDDPITYHLPDTVLSGAQFPALRTLRIGNVTPEQSNALAQLEARLSRGRA